MSNSTPPSASLSDSNGQALSSPTKSPLDPTRPIDAPPPLDVTPPSLPPIASNVLRLHGLPYTVTEEQIRHFFKDFDLSAEEAVVFFTEGLHRGTGFVRLRRAADTPRAMEALHRQHIDPNRYVELAVASEAERRETLEQQETSSKTHVLRLRGLPFAATEADVWAFVKGVDGVTRVDISRDSEGRNTGDAFLELATDADVDGARRLHNQTMGARYIEVLASTVYDREAIMRAASQRARRDRRPQRPQRGAPVPMAPPGLLDPMLAAYMGYVPPVFGEPSAGRGAALFPMFPGQPPLLAPRPPSAHVVRIRGVPYAATEESIAEFFAGVKIPPQGVHMVYNEQNRPTGEAFVELEEETDVAAALDKNGGAMGNRYIEVFQSSAAAMQRLGSPYAGMMGMMPYPMQGMGMFPQMFF